jgi:hypothetical protein
MKKLLLALVLLALPSLASAQVNYVVNAYDLTDTSFTYCTQVDSAASPTCGTAATSGWIRLPATGPQGGKVATAVVEWVTKAATSLEYQVECKLTASGLPVVVESSNTIGSATQEAVVIWAHNWHSCRVGLKLTTDTGTNSVTAYIVQN